MTRLSGNGGAKMPPSPKTSQSIRHIAAEGLQRPSSLNAKQVRALAASAMAHIEPRGGNGPKRRK